MTGEVTSCVLWDRSLSDKGYALVRHAGKTVRVHRLTYEETHGPIPDAHDVHHVCGSKNCINPDHLAAIPQRRHVGLHSRGRGQALDAERVRTIRRRLADGDRQVTLARDFGVTESTINDIHHRRTWRHLT